MDFNPNLGALETTYDMAVQTVGPSSHAMAHLSKSCGGCC